MRFFEIDTPEEWGDTERILKFGMTTHLPDIDGKLQLERCGPCIPPLSLSGLSDVVVTDAFRCVLERANLAQLQFQPVIKAHIVDFAWELIDFRSDATSYFPGEPEDTVLSLPHSPQIADRLGEVWQVMMDDGAVLESSGGDVSDLDVEAMMQWMMGNNPGYVPPTIWPITHRVIASTWNGEHLFFGRIPKAGRFLLGTERAKDWLERHIGEWVQFRELEAI